MARTTANTDIDDSQTKNETQETQNKLVKQRTSYALSRELEEKISSLTQGYKPYIRRTFLNLAVTKLENAETLCDYIITEQNEIKIKESTKEGKIKTLLYLSKNLNDKSFKDMTKQDVLSYLNSLKKSSSVDPSHKSIGTYNGRQMILLKFFRWLYNPDVSEIAKRITPPCMNGVKRLPRREKSPYKPSDLWTDEEHALFLKYCPLIRDRAFHAMARDTSARPAEILNLKLRDVLFKLAADGTQYAEVLVSGKTKPRTLPLIDCIPYIKEWIQNHPAGSNPESWLFVSLSKTNFGQKLSRDGLLKQYQDRYRNFLFPNLLQDDTVPEADKAYIKNMLTKPWNLYVIRHAALTSKSQILKEHTLRDHAGWSISSKMPQVYIHYFGTESSNSLLEAYGIVKHDEKKSNVLKTIS